ncbi:hypothetical protein [Cronobacter sakazakii]|uniref:hypothetical protein n=1 Tax=Cronobacter sakazakii TaxID=28141 RepID=UPI001EFD0597|nr:hypothetical protein [Cronobacter sakazakii]
MNNDELIAAGHELAKCLDSDTPLIDITKMIVRLADKLDVTTLALREKTKHCEQLAAENAAQREFIATCFHAAGDGGDMDGADIQALGERLGLFGRETYQPVIHGYICGHEPGEDSVYVMKKNSATDAFLREVRAQVWIKGSEPPEFGRYWVRYETDVGPQYCSAKWMEYNFCAGSDTNIHKIWLDDLSRSITPLRGVTHYTKLPPELEAAHLRQGGAA